VVKRCLVVEGRNLGQWICPMFKKALRNRRCPICAARCRAVDSLGSSDLSCGAGHNPLHILVVKDDGAFCMKWLRHRRNDLASQNPITYEESITGCVAVMHIAGSGKIPRRLHAERGLGPLQLPRNLRVSSLPVAT
jgi:hypothetical protein